MNHGIALEKAFLKAHGHGNDYLVFEEGEGWRVTAESVQAVCHRQRGVGGDGIVVLLSGGKERGSGPDARRPKPGPPFFLRMFNPDGSEFERSGNGLRIFGAYLFARGWVGLGECTSVEVGGDRVELEILGTGPRGVIQISAEMGAASFGTAAVGGAGNGRGSEELEGPDGANIRVHPVSVGNPHCVVFREDLSVEELLRLGPFLTSHSAFPAGVNVQLARVVGGQKVQILIWERGVGRTSSSGTSACAVAASSVREGLVPPGRITVEMEGGSFCVTVSPDMAVRLEGPVELVCAGELTEAFLRELA